MQRKENILTTTTTTQTTTTTLFRSAIACSEGWQCLLSVSIFDWILSFIQSQLKSVWTTWKISWIYHKLHYQLAIAYSAGWPMPCLPSASPISASISSSGPFLVLKCTKQIQLLTFDNQPILTLKSARVFIQLSWTNLAQHRCSSTANSNLIRWKRLLILILIQHMKCPDIWLFILFDFIPYNGDFVTSKESVLNTSLSTRLTL